MKRKSIKYTKSIKKKTMLKKEKTTILKILEIALLNFQANQGSLQTKMLGIKLKYLK